MERSSSFYDTDLHECEELLTNVHGYGRTSRRCGVTGSGDVSPPIPSLMPLLLFITVMRTFSMIIFLQQRRLLKDQTGRQNAPFSTTAENGRQKESPEINVKIFLDIPTLDVFKM